MRLNTLPYVLFPNPVQHPNYKISFLEKVREDILNVDIYLIMIIELVLK